MTESSYRKIQERTGWQQGIFHHFVHPIKDDKGACITSKPVLMNTKTQRPVVFLLPLSTSPFLLLNFCSHFFSYYYLSDFPSLPLHIC